MSSENSKASDLHRLLFNLSDKINLKRSNKYVGLSYLTIYYTWKNVKKSYKNNKLKISAPTWNENLKYLMDPILYQIFNVILFISSKNMKQWLLRIYINQIKNKITLRKMTSGVQPEIFHGKGGFVKLRHSDKYFVKNSRKNALLGKCFLLDSLKTAFWVVNLT